MLLGIKPRHRKTSWSENKTTQESSTRSAFFFEADKKEAHAAAIVWSKRRSNEVLGRRFPKKDFPRFGIGWPVPVLLLIRNSLFPSMRREVKGCLQKPYHLQPQQKAEKPEVDLIILKKLKVNSKEEMVRASFCLFSVQLKLHPHVIASFFSRTRETSERHLS